MSRPVCANCGKSYGQKDTRSEIVRWDTPSVRYERANVRGPADAGFIQKGDIRPAPPYRGNGIVVRETFAYVSADDGRAVMTRHVWDGETYRGGYDPFCTLRCALDYARKAYRARRWERP